MFQHLKLLVLCLMCLLGCDTSTSPETCRCDSGGTDVIIHDHIPPVADNDPKVSLTGKYISYSHGDIPNYLIKDIVSGDVSSIQLKNSLLVNEKVLFNYAASWCPYNEYLLLVKSVIARTNGDLIDSVTPTLWIYDVRTGATSKLTCSLINDDPSILQEVQWLSCSVPGNDVIAINGQGHGVKQPPVVPITIFIQRDSAVFGSADVDIWYGRDGHRFYANTTSGDGLTIDGKQILTKSTFVKRAAWSPSGRFLVVEAAGETRFGGKCNGQEAWIYDLKSENFDRPKFVIDLLNQRCLESRRGLQTTFLTDTTIVAQYHLNGANQAFLYEIDFKGRQLRQLTN